MAHAMAFREQFGPRERALAWGLESIGDSELLALVLGSGTPKESVLGLATALLEEHDGLVGLGRVGPGVLALRDGLGPAKALRVAAASELGRRMAAQAALEHRTPIRDSGTVARWGQARLGWLDHEELWLLALDGHHQLRAARRVHIGGLGGMSLALRDPLRVALREGASAVVLVHNHPSGNPSPSEEDLRFTLAFEEAAQLVGTPLLDHVIVARHSHTSMVDDRWFVHRQAAHRTSSKCPVNEPGRES